MKKLFLLTLAAICFGISARAQDVSGAKDAGTITRAENGTSYRLVSIGDKLPRLFINNKEVPSAQLGAYGEIIGNLQNDLWARQRKQAQINNAENAQQLNKIAADLVSQKIVLSVNALFSFRLDSREFVVNGKKQPFDIFTRFKNKFIISPDKVYQFNN